VGGGPCPSANRDPLNGAAQCSLRGHGSPSTAVGESGMGLRRPSSFAAPSRRDPSRWRRSPVESAGLLCVREARDAPAGNVPRTRRARGSRGMGQDSRSTSLSAGSSFAGVGCGGFPSPFGFARSMAVSSRRFPPLPMSSLILVIPVPPLSLAPVPRRLEARESKNGTGPSPPHAVGDGEAPCFPGYGASRTKPPARPAGPDLRRISGVHKAPRARRRRRPRPDHESKETAEDATVPARRQPGPRARARRLR